MSVPCLFCGKDINPHDLSTWKQVSGLVGGPKKDSMVLREDTGRYSCTPCVHKIKDKQAPDQETLFGEPVRPGPLVTEEAILKFLGDDPDAK